MDHGWAHDWRVEWRLTNGECQGKLASRMREVVAARKDTEKPFKFVVNVGDNFYPAGVVNTEDPGTQPAGALLPALPHACACAPALAGHHATNRRARASLPRFQCGAQNGPTSTTHCRP